MPPSKLARLFGPLLFGLPEDDTFERTYDAYIKAGNATEHLLLAYIRDTGTLETLPTKLASHIQGYPNMLSSDIFLPSRGVKSVPITSIERTVRLYSVDLVKTACEFDLGEISEEWAACCTDNDHHGRDPQLSDRYRKLINLRGSAKQGRSKNQIKYDGGLSSREQASSPGPDIESYSTLASKEWGDFMTEVSPSNNVGAVVEKLTGAMLRDSPRRMSRSWPLTCAKARGRRDHRSAKRCSGLTLRRLASPLPMTALPLFFRLTIRFKTMSRSGQRRSGSSWISSGRGR